MLSKKIILISVILMLLVSVCVTPGVAAAPQSKEDKKALKEAEKEDKSGALITTKILFASDSGLYDYAPDGRPHLMISSARHNEGMVTGKIAIAGQQMDWPDISQYKHDVKIVLIDNGEELGFWQDPEPTTDESRVIGFLIPSGSLSDQAYLELYVDGKPEFCRTIFGNQAPGFSVVSRYDAEYQASQIECLSLVLDKKNKGGYTYPRMVSITIRDNGAKDYPAPPEMWVIAHFNEKGVAEYKKPIPLAWTVNPSNISIWWTMIE